MTFNPIIMIPARLAATRLPNKPLLNINGTPMIVRVWQQAIEASLGPVVVAAGDQEIVDIIHKVGGEAVLTDPNLPSGSDRIWAALQSYDPNGHYDVILNLQGDLPNISGEIMEACLSPFSDGSVDMTTPVAEFHDLEGAQNPNTVKAVVAISGQALYFTRGLPYGNGPYYHHIGVYGYRRTALEKFIALSRSPLEIRESLEQLRALENGFYIKAIKVSNIPISIDTQEDLNRAIGLL